MLVRTLQNETVDALCHRHYGSTAGRVEAVLKANPGLADHGPILPQGIEVEMPAQDQGAAPTIPLIQLWD